MNHLLLISPARQRTLLLAAALAAVGAAVLLAVMPSDALALVGGGPGGNGATEASKTFKKNGLSSVQSVGAVVFAVVAIGAIARGTFGGKAGQGLAAFAVACLGMAVSLSPEAVMSGIGGWFTGLFEA